MPSPHVAIAKNHRCSLVVRGCLGIVSAVLLVDALVLMAARHLHVGVLVPAVLGAAGLWLSLRWQAVQQWRTANARNARWWSALWGVFALWVVSVAAFWVYLAQVGVQPQAAPPVQAIVVLGSGTKNGHPRPALAARLDTAAELARLQPKAVIAVCGGVDWGETESEAAVMARYLQQQHGIAPERMVLEAQSTSTELNLRLSRPLLQARGVEASAPTAIVSSDFHLMRSMRIAHQQGLSDVTMVAAPTPLASRYNAWLREYFAVASSWLLREF